MGILYCTENRECGTGELLSDLARVHKLHCDHLCVICHDGVPKHETILPGISGEPVMV